MKRIFREISLVAILLLAILIAFNACGNQSDDDDETTDDDDTGPDDDDDTPVIISSNLFGEYSLKTDSTGADHILLASKKRVYFYGNIHDLGTFTGELKYLTNKNSLWEYGYVYTGVFMMSILVNIIQFQLMTKMVYMLR